MNVKLLSYTALPQEIVAAAAKNCYSPSNINTLMDFDNDEEVSNFIGRLSDLGHESPIEHASFTFAIEDVSRSLLAQLTRHRIASFSVKSQRYIEMDNFRYVTPPSIARHSDTRQIYKSFMQECTDIYNVLVDKLSTRLAAIENIDINKAKKAVLEDARFVLPNACCTSIVMTMNARSLRNFFRLRCCNRAQWEIRELAEEMFKLVVKVAPDLFKNAGPACVRGACPEGKMSCGKIEEVRAKYHDLSQGNYKTEEPAAIAEVNELFYDTAHHDLMLITTIDSDHSQYGYKIFTIMDILQLHKDKLDSIEVRYNIGGATSSPTYKSFNIDTSEKDNGILKVMPSQHKDENEYFVNAYSLKNDIEKGVLRRIGVLRNSNTSENDLTINKTNIVNLLNGNLK